MKYPEDWTYADVLDYEQDAFQCTVCDNIFNNADKHKDSEDNDICGDCLFELEDHNGRESD